MSLREIDRLLVGERDWLREKLARWEAWRREHPPLRFEDGEELPLLGERWSLRVLREEGRRRPLIRREQSPVRAGRITLSMPAGLDPAAHAELAYRSLESWYRRLARRIIEARIERWAPIVGARPRKLNIRDTRSRWGSCSATGTLSFGWRIILAIPAVVDYLVVHELCHLHHLDHSDAFWREVARVLPGHERAQVWLREHGEDLHL